MLENNLRHCGGINYRGFTFLPLPPDGIIHREGEVSNNEVFPFVHFWESVKNLGHRFYGGFDVPEKKWRNYASVHTCLILI